MKRKYNGMVDGQSNRFELTQAPLIIDFSNYSRKISSISVFSDHVWDFTNETPWSRHTDSKINFDLHLGEHGKLSDPQHRIWMTWVKQFFESLIYSPPVSHPSLTTICKGTYACKLLVKFMLDYGVLHPNEVTPILFDLFLESLSELETRAKQPISNLTLHSRIRNFNFLGEQRGKFPLAFNFDPWAKYGSANSWTNNAAKLSIPSGRQTTAQLSDDLISSIFTSSLEALKIGQLLVNHLYGQRAEKRAALKCSRRNAEIPLSSLEELNFDIRTIANRAYIDLRTACFMITGLLTGMRATEIFLIPESKANFWIEDEIVVSDYAVKVFFVKSVMTKALPAPKIEKWQTVPLVEKALSLLSAASALLANDSRSLVFRSRWREKNSSVSAVRPMSVHLMRGEINRFLGVRGLIDPKSAPITIRSFRKTFARVLITQGLGLKEIQDQLHHLDPDITRGYCAPSIKEAIQKGKFIASRQLHESLITGSDDLTGGGASEMFQMRKDFAGMCEEDQERFLDRLPHKFLIEQVDHGLCIYIKERALCGGLKFNCKPAECKNSVVRIEANLGYLKTRLANNRELLKKFSNHPLKKCHLKEQERTLLKLIGKY